MNDRVLGEAIQELYGYNSLDDRRERVLRRVHRHFWKVDLMLHHLSSPGQYWYTFVCRDCDTVCHRLKSKFWKIYPASEDD